MPKSREHGQGALYWVAARGMWRAVLDVGFDPTTGARLQKARMSKTKDGAVKKLNIMLRERDSLGIVLDRSARVRDLGSAWLKDVADRSRPHTLANYKSHVKGNIRDCCTHWETASPLNSHQSTSAACTPRSAVAVSEMRP